MLENMGYWQNGLEFEKKVMLPYGDAAWIRVNRAKFVFDELSSFHLSQLA